MLEFDLDRLAGVHGPLQHSLGQVPSLLGNDLDDRCADHAIRGGTERSCGRSVPRLDVEVRISGDQCDADMLA